MGWNFFKDVLGGPDPGANDPSDPSSANYKNPANGPDYGKSAADGAKGHWNPDGSWTWDTGSAAGQTVPANQAQANKDLYNQSVGDAAAAKTAQDEFRHANYEGQAGVIGTTDLSGALDHTIGRPEGVPGGTLDTANSEAERANMEQLVGHLQQVAATGSGEWEKTLSDATHRAEATASAIGQSQANTGGNYAESLRNIGNAQSSAAQRSVGQGEILRAQTKQNAQDQLAGLLGTQGNQDIAQSASEGAAKQGVREANQALNEEGQKTTMGYASGAGQAIISLLSDGGTVPGEPEVFGNDSRNDTVPAKLSPGEIVIDREHAQTPEMAAQRAFEIALQNRGGQKLADGGKAWRAGDKDPTNTGFSWTGNPTQAPSIENGGLLDTTNIDQNRGDTLSLADMLGASAAGNGPSVAPQLITNAADQSVAGSIANAQREQQAGNASAMTSAIANQQAAGGEAAGHAQNETNVASRKRQDLISALRARDLASAQAQQQAEWRNTAANIGVNLSNQHLIQGLISGAGQGAAAFAGALKGKDSGGGYSSNPDNLTSLSDNPFDSGSSPDEWNSFGGDDEQGSGLKSGGGDDGMASGGIVMTPEEYERSSRFIKALHRKRAT
jgi:hypothetical protein